MGSRYQLRRINIPPSAGESQLIIPLEKESLKFGRNPDQVDVTLNSAYHANMISRDHGEIVKQRNDDGTVAFYLMDRSLNGTYVNDYRVQTPVLLHPGDTINFGHINGAAIQPGDHAPQQDPEFTYVFEKVPRSNVQGVGNLDHPAAGNFNLGGHNGAAAALPQNPALRFPGSGGYAAAAATATTPTQGSGGPTSNHYYPASVIQQAAATGPTAAQGVGFHHGAAAGYHTHPQAYGNFQTAAAAGNTRVSYGSANTGQHGAGLASFVSPFSASYLQHQMAIIRQQQMASLFRGQHSGFQNTANSYDYFQLAANRQRTAAAAAQAQAGANARTVPQNMTSYGASQDDRSAPAGYFLTPQQQTAAAAATAGVHNRQTAVAPQIQQPSMSSVQPSSSTVEWRGSGPCITSNSNYTVLKPAGVLATSTTGAYGQSGHQLQQQRQPQQQQQHSSSGALPSVLPASASGIGAETSSSSHKSAFVANPGLAVANQQRFQSVDQLDRDLSRFMQQQQQQAVQRQPPPPHSESQTVPVPTPASTLGSPRMKANTNLPANFMAPQGSSPTPAAIGEQHSQHQRPDPQIVTLENSVCSEGSVGSPLKSGSSHTTSNTIKSPTKAECDSSVPSPPSAEKRPQEVHSTVSKDVEAEESQALNNDLLRLAQQCVYRNSPEDSNFGLSTSPSHSPKPHKEAVKDDNRSPRVLSPPEPLGESTLTTSRGSAVFEAPSSAEKSEPPADPYPPTTGVSNSINSNKPRKKKSNELSRLLNDATLNWSSSNSKGSAGIASSGRKGSKTADSDSEMSHPSPPRSPSRKNQTPQKLQEKSERIVETATKLSESSSSSSSSDSSSDDNGFSDSDVPSKKSTKKRTTNRSGSQRKRPRPKSKPGRRSALGKDKSDSTKTSDPVPSTKVKVLRDDGDSKDSDDSSIASPKPKLVKRSVGRKKPVTKSKRGSASSTRSRLKVQIGGKRSKQPKKTNSRGRGGRTRKVSWKSETTTTTGPEYESTGEILTPIDLSDPVVASKFHDPTQECGSHDSCKKPSDDTVQWVACDGCECWFHCICVSVDESELENDDFEFKCATCTQGS